MEIYKASMEDFEKLSHPGAYALVTEARKVAYVGRGTSILGSLARRLKEFPATSDQTLVFIHGEPEITYRRLYQRLEGEGYKLESKPPTIFKVVEEAVPNPIEGMKGFLVLVWLKNTGQTKVLSGVFQTVAAAREWIAAISLDGTTYDLSIYETELRQKYLDAMDAMPIDLNMWRRG